MMLIRLHPTLCLDRRVDRGFYAFFYAKDVLTITS
eukprot:SAG11_NODE_1858_length_4159_cov_22.716256_2_plen_35_part_00